jgi:hypothetical protein
MTWAYTAVASVVVGSAVSASGSDKAGKAAYKQGQIEYNQELNKGNYEVKVLTREMEERISMQIAQAGASGVAADVGSPIAQNLKTLDDLNEDRTQILRNSSQQAWKLWNAGSNAKVASGYQATGSLLSGISSAASIMKPT